MFQVLKQNPAGLLCAMSNELARRSQVAEATDIDQLLTVINACAHTAAYATKAKALFTRPLKNRSLPVEPANWRKCSAALYALWLGISQQEAENQLAALGSGPDPWHQFVPDPDNVKPEQLDAFYSSLGPFQGCGLHEYNDLALALRWYAAENLAHVANGRGVFDFGGGDGVSCTILAHLGVRDVALIEPNKSAQSFCTWINKELGQKIACCDGPPARKFGAGMSTEVLEHVLDPLGLLKCIFEMLEPGGVFFVTSSFGMPSPQHLKCNIRYAGHEGELMRSAGFVPWSPPRPAPIPFLASWGFWQRG